MALPESRVKEIGVEDLFAKCAVEPLDEGILIRLTGPLWRFSLILSA